MFIILSIGQRKSTYNTHVRSGFLFFAFTAQATFFNDDLIYRGSHACSLENKIVVYSRTVRKMLILSRFCIIGESS